MIISTLKKLMGSRSNAEAVEKSQYDNTALTILFADIAKSSQLYDKQGDKKAREIVSTYINFMTDIIHNHHGKIIKTIGDEVMSSFPKVDNAIEASIEIQKNDKKRDLGIAENSNNLQVRIGCHHGSVIEDENTKDIHGHAVNIAARMVNIAKPGEIITTEHTVQLLSPLNKNMAREFDYVKIKGVQGNITIYEILWEKDFGRHTIIAPTAYTKNITPACITLTYKGRPLRLDQSLEKFFIGRSPNCQLIVPSDVSSREHMAIEFRRGKFIVKDQSTNGTYVKILDSTPIFIRREEIVLSDNGIISLGDKSFDDNQHLIYFSCSS